MIKSVIITDITKAVSYSHKPKIDQTAWITTVDDVDKRKVLGMHRRFSSLNVKPFAQYFMDLSDEHAEETYVKPYFEEQAPSEAHMNNIVSFLVGLVDTPVEHHLGVNCHAGISRSTAIGVIAWVMSGRTPTEALEEILKVRPMAWPNLRMLRLASARVGVNMFTPVLEWKQTQHGGVWTGTLDDSYNI
jgi:predicted protein tyrosine phosphatase